MWIPQLYALYQLYNSAIAPSATALIPIIVLGQVIYGVNSASGGLLSKWLEQKPQNPEIEEIKKIIFQMKDVMEQSSMAKPEVVASTTNNYLSSPIGDYSWYFVGGCGIVTLLCGLALGVGITSYLNKSNLDLKQTIEKKAVQPLAEGANKIASDNSDQQATNANIIVGETTIIRQQTQNIQDDLVYTSKGFAKWATEVEMKLDKIGEQIGSLGNVNIAPGEYYRNRQSDLSTVDNLATSAMTPVNAQRGSFSNNNSLVNTETNSLVIAGSEEFDSYWDNINVPEF